MMQLTSIGEGVFGFLFRPHRTALNRLTQPGTRLGGWKSHVYIIYLSVLLGVTLFFFMFYPEPLYYGSSGAELKEEVPSIIIANPLLGMLGMILFELLFTFLFLYLAVGYISFAVMRLLTRATRPAHTRREYLALFANSFHPLLLMIPLITFRLFFYEGWIHLKPMYPFVDWTTSNVWSICILGLLFAWKFFIELRVNQAVFRARLGKAVVPLLVQAVLLAVLLAFPLLLNDLFFNAFKDTLV
jgi:hypothetical protein